MRGQYKTNEQHIIEPQGLCQITTELEESEAQHKQVEEAMQESEERYKALFDRSLYFVYVHDFEGNFLDANKATLNLLGYTKKDISSLSFSSLLDEEQLPIAIKSLGEILKNGYQKNPTKFKLKTKKGDYVWVETEASLIYRKGKPYAVQGIARDITESTLAEEALQESKEKYRTLAENAMDGIYIISPEKGFEYVNPAFEKIFGYKAKEVCKKDFNFSGLIYPDDRKLILEREKARKKGKRLPPVYSFRILTKNGNIKNVEVNTVPLPGEKVRILGILRDVTQRTQAEEALRESEEKFKTMFNNASDAIFIHDLSGRFMEVNQVACKRLGYTKEELLKMNLTDLDSPKLVTIVPARADELNQRGHIFYETVHVRQDGTAIPIELSSRIIEHEGEPVALSIARDITERKQAEEERKQNFERLRKSLEETINALASAVEMRDPYTAGHQHRTTTLACAIAEEMDLSKHQIEGIRMAGIIHDVGKIKVPAEILSWPDRLTEIDFNVIKTHPQVGYDILKNIELPYSVAQIVLQHHERMNGSGYPAGKPGEDILLETRILSVSDVVEAMASHRPYRPALGVDKALEEIKKNKGVLYDSEVVNVCLKLFNEKSFEFSQLKNSVL